MRLLFERFNKATRKRPFGVLTVDNIEQAVERAGTKAGNKGEEAALAALEMVNILSQIKL